MEGPISKFMHVQQPDAYWHQSAASTAFKSPDLIELNSDTERSARNAEPLNYSSSQEEAETEDDGCDATEVHLKEALPGVYDVTSNDEESCHLLQTEDDSESSHSEHAWNSSGSSRSSSSNGGTMSEGEDGHRSRIKQTDNYWDMSAEQEKYYTDQFLTLQIDLHGLVSGAVAKGFFEKSKLPLGELREIWQLADISRDGCLDLNEFKMAMHLVVLRRHGLPIPSHFYSRQPDFAHSSSNAFKVRGSTSTPKSKSSSTAPNGSNPPVGQQSPHGKESKASHHNHNTQGKRPSKEWTTFENDPINFSSSCDTSGVVKFWSLLNPEGLVAPVPVRLKTPEDKLILSGTIPTSSSKSHQQLQLKAIQRPKLSGHHPKVSTGTIAPPPPPRRKTHVRSSSLDLNRLTISSDHQQQDRGDGRSFLSPCHQGGAFSVYRKPQAPKTATIHEPPTALYSSGNIPNLEQSGSNLITTKVQLEREVSDLKGENDLLTRVSAQLLDQLSNLQSRRHAAAYKIHHLHSNL